MQDKKIIYFILIVLLFLALILGTIILFLKDSQKMEINFLDVGQGDAILIENGKDQILIDSGKNGKVILEKLGEAMPFWDRKIELIVVTHPDADHYGGLDAVLDYYKVENLIKTEAENESEQWRSFKKEIEREGANVLNSTFGTTINFKTGAKLKVLYPIYKVSESVADKNDISIVTKLEFGENEFLFTGDLSMQGEKEILNSGLDISSGVIKVGHHGSRSSTGDEFLKKVNPEEAIISVGKGNSYGHPHEEIISKLNSYAIRIWRTDEDGSIIFKCRNIDVSCEGVGN